MAFCQRDDYLEFRPSISSASSTLACVAAGETLASGATTNPNEALQRPLTFLIRIPTVFTIRAKERGYTKVYGHDHAGERLTFRAANAAAWVGR